MDDIVQETFYAGMPKIGFLLETESKEDPPKGEGEDLDNSEAIISIKQLEPTL